MKQRSAPVPHRPETVPLEYELVEIEQFGHGTPEAAAVTATLGKPSDLRHAERFAMPLVIVGYDAISIAALLSEQRSAAETDLRPIAVVGLDSARLADPLIRQFADFLLPPRPGREELLDTGTTLQALGRRIDEIPVAMHDDTLRLLQFLHCRNQTLEPIIDASSSLAYDYPLADRFMDTAPHNTLAVLNDLGRHGIVESACVDRVFICPACHDYRIAVKELCPECHSPNLSMESSIHHFRCGYVAPESEFMIDGRPICPKCHCGLRHIGVEYNRPGYFAVCHDCGHWASEPDLRAWCVACNTYHLPGELIAVPVRRFRLAQNGIQVARVGRWDRMVADVIGFEARGQGSKNHAAHGSDSYAEELTRLLALLAAGNRGPMALYRVDLAGNTANRAQAVQKIGSLLHSLARYPDQVARVGTGTFLIALPHGADETLESDDLRHYIVKHLHTEVTVSVLNNIASEKAQA